MASKRIYNPSYANAIEGQAYPPGSDVKRARGAYAPLALVVVPRLELRAQGELELTCSGTRRLPADVLRPLVERATWKRQVDVVEGIECINPELHENALVNWEVLLQ